MNTNQEAGVVKEVQDRLKRIPASGLTTGQVRSISSNMFRSIEDKSVDNVLQLCEQLLAERTSALGVVAYDWAFRVRKQYKADVFPVFEQWLKEYVSGWGSCDDFCTHAFGALLAQDNHLFQHVLTWTEHPDFWVRRAAAVILIYPIKQGKAQGLDPFTVADRLMHDPHYLVLKGYGWMLKVLSTVEPEQVHAYLLKNKSVMPRLSLRYAAEKFDQERKAAIMS